MRYDAVVVLGAGRRVVDDLVPTLLGAGVPSERIRILRQRGSPLAGHPSIPVFTSAEDVYLSISGERTLLISCLPAKEQSVTLRFIQECEGIGRVLIDTPVSDFARESHGYLDRVSVLEDSVLIPWALAAGRRSAGERTFVYSDRALYAFHGLALLSSVLSGARFTRLMRLPRPVHIQVLEARLKESRGLIIARGPRDYERGSIKIAWRRGRPLILGEAVTASENRGALTELLSRMELEQLGGACERLQLDSTSLMTNPIRTMRLWKRVGLYLGMEALINHGTDHFPSVQECVSWERAAKF